MAYLPPKHGRAHVQWRQHVFRPIFESFLTKSCVFSAENLAKTLNDGSATPQCSIFRLKKGFNFPKHSFLHRWAGYLLVNRLPPYLLLTRKFGQCLEKFCSPWCSCGFLNLVAEFASWIMRFSRRFRPIASCCRFSLTALSPEARSTKSSLARWKRIAASWNLARKFPVWSSRDGWCRLKTTKEINWKIHFFSGAGAGPPDRRESADDDSR